MTKTKSRYQVLLFICFMIPCMLLLSACGDQSIIEKSYTLVNMQIITDNTAVGNNPYEDGEFTDYFGGDLQIKGSVVQIGKEKSYLIWKDDNTGLSAKFEFVKYSPSYDEYPAYKFNTSTVYHNNIEITSLPHYADEALSNAYNSVTTFSMLLKLGETTMQIVTQNKIFVCGISIVNTSSNTVLFMSQLYGISL